MVAAGRGGAAGSARARRRRSRRVPGARSAKRSVRGGCHARTHLPLHDPRPVHRYGAALTLVHVFQLPAMLMPEGMLLSTGLVGDHFQAVNSLLDDEKREAERLGASA